MITFEQFQEECPQNPSKENYDAFVRMSKCFRAEHCTSFREAQDIMIHAMDSISR